MHWPSRYLAIPFYLSFLIELVEFEPSGTEITLKKQHHHHHHHHHLHYYFVLEQLLRRANQPFFQGKQSNIRLILDTSGFLRYLYGAGDMTCGLFSSFWRGSKTSFCIALKMLNSMAIVRRGIPS